MNTDVCVVIPTFNEQDTIAGLIYKLKNHNYPNILVVDDSSDNTAVFAQGMGASVCFGGRNGLAYAIRKGLTWASEKSYKYALVIDAGGTHDPVSADLIVNGAKIGYALTIGSRFMLPAYTTQGWRTKLSLFAAKCVHKLLGLHVHDVTSGYRCYDLSVFNKALLSDSQAWGHAVQIELLVLCSINNGLIREVPIAYLPLTNSTLSVKSIVDAAFVMYRMFMLKWVC
jgi:glycosyltransferase involved in cell wall biosynthesis